jgi:hypothetical protein
MVVCKLKCYRSVNAVAQMKVGFISLPINVSIVESASIVQRQSFDRCLYPRRYESVCYGALSFQAAVYNSPNVMSKLYDEDCISEMSCVFKQSLVNTTPQEFRGFCLYT